jgi:hypothetical protein
MYILAGWILAISPLAVIDGFPLAPSFHPANMNQQCGTCVSESVRLQSSKGVRWEYENGLYLSRNFANMSTATSVRDIRRFSPKERTIGA